MNVSEQIEDLSVKAADNFKLPNCIYLCTKTAKLLQEEYGMSALPIAMYTTVGKLRVYISSKTDGIRIVENRLIEILEKLKVIK